jgi:hypothetical protein
VTRSRRDHAQTVTCNPAVAVEFLAGLFHEARKKPIKNPEGVKK